MHMHPVRKHSNKPSAAVAFEACCKVRTMQSSCSVAHQSWHDHVGMGWDIYCIDDTCGLDATCSSCPSLAGVTAQHENQDLSTAGMQSGHIYKDCFTLQYLELGKAKEGRQGEGSGLKEAWGEEGSMEGAGMQ